MERELSICGLKELAEILLTAASGDETIQLKEIIKSPLPEHREFLIVVRNQALQQCAFDWAVVLSHFIAAMAEDGFWAGEVINPSSN